MCMLEISSNIYYGKSFVLLKRDGDTVEVEKDVVDHLHDDDVVEPDSE